MAAPKGHPRYGGRAKGTKNKDTQTAQQLAAELGVCPLTILLHFAQGNWKALGYPEATRKIFTADGDPVDVDVISPDLRQKSAKDALPFLRPTLKSVEVTGDAASSAFNSFAQMVAGLVDQENADKGKPAGQEATKP
jgi:hypothetical protein